MDATGGSGSNSPVWPIVDDNGAVDMNGTIDNLDDRIANLEMVFAYLKNKKMLERKGNKLNKETGNWSLCRERLIYYKFAHFVTSLYWNDAFHWLETGDRQITLYQLNIDDHDHPIITTIEIPNGLHQGRNFLQSFGSKEGSYDPMLKQIDTSSILHLQGRLFESRGCLLLSCRDDIDYREFTIYEMVKGLWTVRYLVNTDEFMTPFH
ncbi:hypothetical protein Tco_0532440 [Tanacetum coccineum]